MLVEAGIGERNRIFGFDCTVVVAVAENCTKLQALSIDIKERDR